MPAAPATALAEYPASVGVPIGTTGASVLISTRRAGDLRPSSPDGVSRRAAVLAGEPWRVTTQVHGHVVSCGPGRGEPADGLVSPDGSGALAMFAADCALLGVASDAAVTAVVHAGWHGLVAGVVEAAAAEMRTHGAQELFAVRGPCIGAECYEFGPADLDRVAGLYGDDVRSETTLGRPALDLGAVVAAAAARAGIVIVTEIDSCTACATSGSGELLWFSHRARGDTARHAMVVTAP